MSIGDKIEISSNSTTDIEQITNVIPVKYNDDGEKQWYEVCDAGQTENIAVIGQNKENEEVIVIIKKNEENLELLSDII